MTDDVNNLEVKLAVVERILTERQKTEDERFGRILDRLDAMDKALELQAAEYTRRLHDLNGEYQRDRQRQSEYVTVDKWETVNETERIARVAALLRVDEKFEDYIKRYEARQREVDLLLAAQSGAADEAKRAVEAQGRKSDEVTREQARRQNRNLGLASLGLALIVFLANIIPSVVR